MIQGEIYISQMFGKLAEIRALNTNTLTNVFCQKMEKGNTICAQCYSRVMLRTFRQVCVNAWQQNGDILSKKVFDYDEIPNLKEDVVFRISAHGELINRTHFINVMLLASNNPMTTVTIWTKRVNIVKEFVKDIPTNLIMIYSSVKVNVKEKLPPGFHKVFTTYTKKYAAKNKVKLNCYTNCMDCLLCYKKKTTDTINELVKESVYGVRKKRKK